MTPQQAFDKLCLIQHTYEYVNWTISTPDNSSYYHLKGNMSKDEIQMIIRQRPSHFSIHEEFLGDRIFCVSWEE